MAQLVCRDLAVGYDGKSVLGGISFKVEKGEYLFITGANGAGKSTLMKTILGLLPPVKGKIITGDGLKIGDAGYLPQQKGFQKDFPASVNEIVISGCQGKCGLRPFYSRKEKYIEHKAIERMGISHLANRCYRELSGGQQQRVLLARALCAAQKMLVLDEPVSGLDPKAAAGMYELLYDLNKNDQITIIMISHDLSAARKYASHILNIGENIFFGKKRR